MHNKEIRIYAGGALSGWRNDYTIAHKIASFYKFHAQEDYYYWLDDTITEEQFNDLYEQGQRVFLLSDPDEWNSVFIEETLHGLSDYYQEQKRITDLDNLIDEMLCDHYNFLHDHMKKEAFAKTYDAYQQYLLNKNWLQLEQSLEAIRQ